MEENLNIKEMVREEIHVTEAVGGETVLPAGTPEKAKQETKPKQQQRKELTPAEIQRRKKMLVYPLIFMVFAGAMWLIFAPSSAEKEDSIQEGFNIDVPLPHEKGMPGDKKEAYEQDAFEKQQKEKMGTLQDFDIAFGEPDGQATVSDPPAAPPEEDAPVRSTSSSVHASAIAYQNINRQLGSFYQQPEPEDDQKLLELEWRIQEMERKQKEEQLQKSTVDEQLDLMEKSYQMAAKYMPAGQNGNPSNANLPNGRVVQATSATNEVTGNDKPVVTPVLQVQERVVSLLAPPMSDADFVKTYGKPRNVGFNTVRSAEENILKNTIRVRVCRTITLTDGKELELRTLEPMMAGKQYIPSGTIVVGTAKIGGERMEVNISSVNYGGAIIPVSLDVYDMHGMKGISVPGSDELNAVKEIAANMGSSLGTSISITESAGAQLAADLGKGVIQGTSQYLSKKFRTVKVTLKANHELYLLPGK